MPQHRTSSYQADEYWVGAELSAKCGYILFLEILNDTVKEGVIAFDGGYTGLATAFAGGRTRKQSKNSDDRSSSIAMV